MTRSIENFEFDAPRSGEGPIPFIETAIAGLGQVSVAIPIIFATVKLIRDVWKSARGPQEPEITDAQLIDLMDAKFREIATTAEAEIARLRELQP